MEFGKERRSRASGTKSSGRAPEPVGVDLRLSLQLRYPVSQGLDTEALALGSTAANKLIKLLIGHRRILAEPDQGIVTVC